MNSPGPLTLPNSHFSIYYTLSHFTLSYSTVIFEVFNNRRDSEVGNTVSYSRGLGFDLKAQYPTWCVCRSTVNLGVELVVKEKSRVHIWAQWRTEGGFGVFKLPPPLPKFRSFDKAEPNYQFLGKYIRNNRTRIWLSLIFWVVSWKALPASYDPTVVFFFSPRHDVT